MRRLFEGGVYSRAAFIRGNTVRRMVILESPERDSIQSPGGGGSGVECARNTNSLKITTINFISRIIR